MEAELMNPGPVVYSNGAPAAPVLLPPTMQALMRAIDSEADLERLDKLMQLHDRWEANEARKAFSAAMARFRAESMTILKTKWVDVPNGPKYFHAELHNVCEAVIPNLSKHGLRHQWIPKQIEGGMIEVTCRITHELGHFEDTTLFGPPDSSGKKSPIQEVASTVTLLERYTLLAATGLAARGQDTDGRKPLPEADKPGDYENWKADATAIADEGSARLKDLWEKTPPDIRRFVTKSDASWWADTKAKAEKITQREGKR